VLDKEKLIQDIRAGLAYLEAYVSSSNSLNLTDTNIHSEDFVGGLLNILYDWNLVNANQYTGNFPCIDLIDSTLGIGIQVTSQTGSGKVNKTLQCLTDHSFSNQISSLWLFTLKRKQTKYTVNVSCPDIEFNWQHHIIDFNSISEKAYRTQDIARLTKLHEYIVTSIPIFPKRQIQKLPLYTPSTTKEGAWLAFSSQSISLVGREEEIEQLSRFCDIDQNYSWWLITGSAGSGKSRLALELCDKYKKNGWDVGFLSRTQYDFTWSDFTPEKNTLIVVDYVSNRTEVVSNVILDLSRRAIGFNKVVRVLLLERDKGSWWRQFSREESLSEESEILAKQYNVKPFGLKGLSKQALLKMAEEIVQLNNEGSLNEKVADKLLNWMAKYQIENLPLYVMIFLTFPDTEEPNELLRKVLNKEARLRFLKFKDIVLPTQIDNLLFLTTIAGGLLPKSYSYKFLESSDVEDLLPNISTLDTELYCNITGSSKDIKYLSGLQPDLLGERYVLDCLNKTGLASGGFMRLLLAAYEFQPEGVLAFTTKTFFDFPEDICIPQLFDLPKDSAAFRLLKARLVSNVMVGLSSIFNGFLHEKLKEIIIAADLYPEEQDLQKYVALAEYNLGCSMILPLEMPFYLRVIFSSINNKAEAMKRFDAVLTRVGENSQIGIMALLNRGTFETNVEQVIRLLTKVINSNYSTNEYRACAYNNRANEYLKKGVHDLAISDRSEVLLLSDTSPDRRFVALLGRGESYLAIGEYHLVTKDMNKIIESNDICESDKLCARLLRAVNYHFMGESVESINELESIVDSLLLKIVDSDHQALVKKAEKSRREGLFEDAINCIKELGEEDEKGKSWEVNITLAISNTLIIQLTESALPIKNQAWKSLQEAIFSSAKRIRVSTPEAF
jgi:tetratricopeptide (TPR) repeat protein